MPYRVPQTTSAASSATAHPQQHRTATRGEPLRSARNPQAPHPINSNATTMPSRQYESVPNPGNARGAMAQPGTPTGYASRPSLGSASGSGSGSAESASMMRPGGVDARGAEMGGVDPDIGPYAHIKKGSMGRLGQRGQHPNTAAAAAASRTTAVGAVPSAGNSLFSDVNSRGTYGYRSSEHSYRTNGGSSAGEKYMYSPGTETAALYSAKGERDIDDYLHEPDRRNDNKFTCCSPRGILNVLVMGLLILGLLMLFAGYPIISHYTRKADGKMGGFGLGGTNGTGQVPQTVNRLYLIDRDTPQSGYKWRSGITNLNYHLVFSDEFNTPGRTFWPGDDPHWEAVDIWYGATADLEWYSPEAVNTSTDGTNGFMQITMEQKPTHNLQFRSGMVQSWNKLCFQGGYIEFSAMLPGSPNTEGWWPGLWTMGNLGRPGYLGTTDGMWPYSYDACDTGILPNQTTATGTPASVATFEKYNKVGLNWLSGMRTPACTCDNSDHPGPNPNVGRSAPEIDALEAQTANGVGEASQSLQTAPFDPAYEWDQTVSTIYDPAVTKYNTYIGGVYQEAISGVSNIPSSAYELSANRRFVTFGFEYQPDWNKNGGGYVIWYIDGKATWRVDGRSMPARPNIDISQRLVPTEPMTIIMNLGMSNGFQTINFDTLTFPATLKIDYVRVFQRDGQSDRVGCDPGDHPTSDYISKHQDVYFNPNLTTWPKPWPKNRLRDGC